MRRRILAAALALPLLFLGAQFTAHGTPSAATLIGYWKFDEGSGATAADSSGYGHPLTLQGGASWAAGAVGASALAVTPQQDAAAAATVIDTSKSFTVSAWVKLANLNGYQTFVSEDGSQVSAFYLQLRGDSHRFAFTRLSYDSPAAFGMIATSPIVPQPGVWYLLTGVYDASAQTASLYVNGGTDTKYGAMRAADGHPAPFNVNYVEVGNEDQFDRSGSYNGYRFPVFYDAIRAAYPQLKIVATTGVSSRTPDVIDDHYYSNDPNVIAGDAHNYDTTSRTGPKRFIGEYAVTQGSPTGTVAGALGEAAFLTGLENDADVVLGASYAPLLVNVNAVSWSSNLIGYDGLTSYGSPSYYVVKMFGNALGDHVAPSQIIGGNGNLWAVASVKAGGTTYVTVVNRGTSATTVDLNLVGVSAVSGGTETVLAGDPAAVNSLTHPAEVSPTEHRAGASGPAFRHTFPANSVTVLSLTTG